MTDSQNEATWWHESIKVVDRPNDDSLCNMLVPLLQRGSPNRLTATASATALVSLPRLPLPCPADRIVSLGDSNAPAAVAAAVVPSCQCSVIPVAQSFADSSWGVTCPQLPSCCDSVVISMDAGVHRPFLRPRAQCSRKTMVAGGKNRKCWHTSCNVKRKTPVAVSKPAIFLVPTIDVIQLLHRDQRTVYVSTCHRRSECSDQFSDSVKSANKYEYNSFWKGAAGRYFRRFQVRFSMQRFWSTFVCGLLLLTVLRPQYSMAAPVPSQDSESGSWKNPCGGKKSNGGSFNMEPPTITSVLTQLKLKSAIINNSNTQLRHRYCKERFPGDDCNIDFHGDFEFPHVPKKLGEPLPPDYDFGNKPVDTLLQETYSNFQTYALALEKLVKNVEKRDFNQRDFEPEYKSLQANFLELMCHLKNLMELRNIRLPDEIDAGKADVLNIPVEDSKNQTWNTVRDWIILKQVMNGVEYFNHLQEHVGKELNKNTQTTHL